MDRETRVGVRAQWEWILRALRGFRAGFRRGWHFCDDEQPPRSVTAEEVLRAQAFLLMYERDEARAGEDAPPWKRLRGATASGASYGEDGVGSWGGEGGLGPSENGGGRGVEEPVRAARVQCKRR